METDYSGRKKKSESVPRMQNEWRIIGLTSYGHALCHVCELAFAALLPAVMIEFSLEADQAAGLMVPGLILFGVGALPSGIWTDRRGPTESMSGYFLSVIAAALLIYFAGSVLVLKIGLACLGAAISIYHPTGLSMLSKGCANRGRAMGINGVAGSFGVAIGPSLGILMLSYFNWRMTYLAIAVASLIGLILTRVTPIQIDVEATLSKSKEGKAGQPAKLLVILFVAMLVGGFNYRCITTALPNYLGDTQTISQTVIEGNSEESESEQATPKLGWLAVFSVFALGAIGQLAGGHLADKFKPALLYPLTILATIPFALLIDRVLPGAGILCAGTLAVFMFAEQPLENTMIADATPAKWRSTIYGLKFILAFGIASTGAYFSGWIWRYYGLARVFDVYAMGAGLMAIIATCYFLALRRFERQKDRLAAES